MIFRILILYEFFDELYELPDVKSCACDCGSIGKKRRKDANEKRKAFYKTEKGIAIKQMYKERIAMKKKLRQTVINNECA